jgi:DNA-binding SARP family transcriptional activator
MSRQADTAAAVQRAVSGGLRLDLLNGFELRFGRQEVLLPRSSQRLLAFLGVHGRPQLRSLVAGTLWADTHDERALASLRSALWRLNGAGHQLVESKGAHLRLAAEIEVDLAQATAHAHRLLDPVPENDLEQLPASLLDAELLPDWYDDWVLVERERFRQIRLHALEAACDCLTARRRFAAAVTAGQAAVSAEPLRETAHRALIRAHLAEGNRNEALRQYRMCRRLLGDAFGVLPVAETTELVADLIVL